MQYRVYLDGQYVGVSKTVDSLEEAFDFIKILLEVDEADENPIVIQKVNCE